VGDVLFRGRRGVFVDVGARDGATISNTFYLEQSLGWTGLCLEPHPDLYNQLVRTRSCQCLNVAASDRSAAGLDFVKFLEEPLGNSGFVSTFRDPARLAGIRHEIIRVPARPLREMLGAYPLVDYLDIDVEGHELAVLRGIDFSTVRFGVIGVECEDGSSEAEEIDGFLAKHGYHPFLHVVGDRFYAAGDSPPSVARLLQKSV
jgi:FkbM family methyltransferase